MLARSYERGSRGGGGGRWVTSTNGYGEVVDPGPIRTHPCGQPTQESDMGRGGIWTIVGVLVAILLVIVILRMV